MNGDNCISNYCYERGQKAFYIGRSWFWNTSLQNSLHACAYVGMRARVPPHTVEIESHIYRRAFPDYKRLFHYRLSFNLVT